MVELHIQHPISPIYPKKKKKQREDLVTTVTAKLSQFPLVVEHLK
jgi:hypothetical protein